MSQFKVVITDLNPGDTQDVEGAEFQASGLDVELVRLGKSAPEDLLPLIADADGLLVCFAKITRQVAQGLKKCKVISRYGIGVDMIDLEATGEYGIPVSNVPGFCIEEVSTHTLAFLLALNRDTVAQAARVRAGKWGPTPGRAPERLLGQVLGIVGLGNIGQVVARKAAALGLTVIGFDPYLDPEKARAVGIEPVGLDALLRRADYVSLHCPLTAETRHMIGREQLALMKPTAYLMNLARGPVVDPAALYEALTGGVIRGAALDVTEPEPLAPDDPLRLLDNVIITPHSAAWSTTAELQLRRDTALNVIQVLQGKPPRAVVNRKWLRTPGSSR